MTKERRDKEMKICEFLTECLTYVLKFSVLMLLASIFTVLRTLEKGKRLLKA